MKWRSTTSKYRKYYILLEIVYQKCSRPVVINATSNQNCYNLVIPNKCKFIIGL